MDRNNFIGSSEISAVMGVNPYMTALKLWAVKSKKVEPDDLSGNEAVEWGVRLEDVVGKKFAEKHDVKVMAYKKRYYHKEYPFLSCELDRIITGTDEALECKTCNAWAWKEWENPDELPLHYIHQVNFAMGITGRKKMWVACLCGGQKYVEKEVLFSQKLFDLQVERAVKFWDMVQKGEQPMTVSDDNKFMIDLYPENVTDDIVEANEEVENLIALRQETKMHIDEMNKEKAAIEAKLKDYIGEASGLKTMKYKVTWKKQNTRPSFDTETMQKNGHYELYVIPNSTRVLRVNNIKEKK